MTESVQVWINGQPQQVTGGLNVASLLLYLGMVPTRVAIERNLDILPRALWEQTIVSEGDRYEIVHLVGGG